MLKSHLLVLLTLVLAAQATPAQTREMTLRNYHHWRQSGDVLFEAMLRAQQLAYLYANANLVVEDRKPLYCQPSTLTLTYDATLSILDKELQVTRRGPDTPIGWLLLDGLRRTFPC